MKKHFALILGCLVITLAHGHPVLQNLNNWGWYDWDYSFFLQEAQRKSMVEYGEFPLWNPYHHGGQPLLAHPHSRMLSPSFILVLLFGTVVGLKLQIFLYLFLGLYGMIWLAKEIGLEGPARLVPPLIFMLSGIFSLHLSIGHTQFFSLAYLPWIFYFYRRSLENSYNILVLVPLVALVIFDGGLSILVMFLTTLFFHSIPESIERRNLRPPIILAVALVSALLLTGIKLIPMTEALIKAESRPPTNLQDHIPLSTLPQIFISRSQGAHLDAYLHPSLKYGWHEYGAYIGIFPLFLVLLGAFTRFRELRWSIFVLALALLLSLGSFFAYSPWEILKGIPLVGSLFLVPSRWLLIAVFEMSLLAGFGFHWLYQRYEDRKYARIGFYVVLAICAADLVWVNGQAFARSFPFPALEVASTSQPFKQSIMPGPTKHFFQSDKVYYISPPNTLVYRTLKKYYPNLIQRYGRYVPYTEIRKIHSEVLREHSITLPYGATSSMYPALLHNSGVVNGYGFRYLKSQVSWSGQQSREVYVPDYPQMPLNWKFSPNRIKLTTPPYEPNLMLINQNYSSGWKFKSTIHLSVKPYEGRISMVTSKSSEKVELLYLPLTFIIGLVLTFFALYTYIALLCWLRVKRVLQNREDLREEALS